jgi:hypothetical protein
MHFSISTVTDTIFSFVFSISAPPLVPNFTLIKASGMPKAEDGAGYFETVLILSTYRRGTGRGKRV